MEKEIKKENLRQEEQSSTSKNDPLLIRNNSDRI
jgi:hypothetical protein